MQAAQSEFGAGSGAAALVSGHSSVHAHAEARIAQWKGCESAVLLGSGYVANLAAVQTLAAVAPPTGVRFLIDKLVHASLIDAVRSVAVSPQIGFRVYPHNHLGKLRRLLLEAQPDELQVVVTESIFSMDGDAADLPGLADLKKQRPFILLLDEAHASGVYGPLGSGYAAELGLTPIVDVSIATLSKAIGLLGGAVCGSQIFCQALVNFGRPYIFSTQIPPALAAGASAAIDVMRDQPQLQQRLRANAVHLRRKLHERNFKLIDGDSPIIPILLDTPQRSLDLAARLLDRGHLAVAIRPPTVPRGGSRLRIALSSQHTDAEINGLIASLSNLYT